MHVALRYFTSTEQNGGGDDDVPLPVGFVYMSFDDTNPADLLGYGTWVRFGQGKFLIGVDENSSDHNSAGDTGGSENITPEGTVSQPSFTGNALGTHTHSFTGNALGTHTHTFTGDALGNHSHGAGTLAPSAHAGTAVQAHANHTHGAGTLDNNAVSAGTPAGTVSSHSHELPISFGNDTATGTNAWRKVSIATFGTGGTNRAHVSQIPTANSAFTSSVPCALSSAVAPTFTGSALGTHDHTITGSTGNESASLTHTVTQPNDHTMSGTSGNASAGTPSGTNASVSAGTPAGSNSSDSAGTPSGTVSQPSFTGDPFDNRPEFVAIFMFRRTA